MKLIQKWLDGAQNFVTGRVLFNQFGKDESLKHVFAQGETKESSEKLVAAMQSLLEAVVSPPSEAVYKIFNAPAAVDKPMIGHDEVEEAIEKDWKSHYTRMNQLRGQLDAYGTDNSEETRLACNDICAEILQEERYINYCWEKVDYYRIHGKLPDDKEDDIRIPEDPVKLANFIQAVKRNIRRNKQLSRENEDNPNYPALVKKYEAILKKINEPKN